MNTDDVIRRPPSSDGLGVGSLLALLIHGLLVAALAWGVHWKRSEVTPVTAELWAAVPQLADAPAPVAPPVDKPPRPVPVAKAEPTPKPPPPEPKPVPKPEPKAAQRDADIAVEKAKKALAEAKEEEARLARERDREKEKEKARKEKERDKEREKEKADKLEKQEKLERQDKEKAEKLKAEKEAARKEAAAREAKEAKAEEAFARKQREDNLKRLNDQLGGPGGSGTGQSADGGGGKAARSAAPSAGYAGRIRARVLPNIVFTAEVSGDPTAVVDVKLSPGGQILSTRILKSSGVPAWDQAVLRALERTEVFPPDIDGRVPPSIEISFNPNRR